MALKVLEKDGFYGYVNLGVLFIFNIASTLSMTTFMMFLPFWVDEFSWDRGALSGAQSVAMIITGLTAPVVGVLIMKFGAKKNIIIGNILAIAGILSLSFMSDMWQLYVGFGIFVGIGFSLGGMLSMMTILNNWFVVKRTMALSIALASAGLGGIVIMPLLMHLITTMGWRFTYRIIAATIFICCVAIPGIFLKNKPADLGQVPDGPASENTRAPEQGGATSSKHYKTPVDFTVKEALKTPAFWLIVGYAAFMLLGLQVLMIHQVAFLLDIGITPGMAAMAGGLMSAVMTVSQVGVGFLGLRFNIHSLAVLSVLSVMAGYILLLFAKSLPLVIVYNILMGAGFGIQMLALGTLIPNYFGMKEFPKIMGFAIPIGTFIGAAGGPGAGIIREMTGSYLPAFQISLGVIVVAFFFIIFAKPSVHHSLIEVKN